MSDCPEKLRPKYWPGEHVYTYSPRDIDIAAGETGINHGEVLEVAVTNIGPIYGVQIKPNVLRIFQSDQVFSTQEEAEECKRIKDQEEVKKLKEWHNRGKENQRI